MLTPEAIEAMKSGFSDWLDLYDSKKDIGDQMKELIKDIAAKAEKKPAIIRSAFSYLKKRRKDDGDTLDDIVNVVMAIEDRQ
jgi:hypothetical protein